MVIFRSTALESDAFMLIECIPNVSEGRRFDVISAMASAISAVPGVRLLDHSSDPSHNRSVFTFAGAFAQQVWQLALFRLLAAVGFWGWFTNHQRLVHTFVTNVRGPAEPLAFASAPVEAVLPVPATTGNVSVSFAALSYAGTLWLTVLSDPDLVPDVAELTGALRRELGGKSRTGAPGRMTGVVIP